MKVMGIGLMFWGGFYGIPMSLATELGVMDIRIVTIRGKLGLRVIGESVRKVIHLSIPFLHHFNILHLIVSRDILYWVRSLKSGIG